MIDSEAIESYLIQSGLAYEQLGDGLWRVEDETDSTPPVIVRLEPPIVYLRLKVLDLPAEGREALYRRLLELNSSGIAFGAYAIEGDEVLLVDTLRSDSLEMAELQASIESIVLAASEHHRSLRETLAQ